MEGGFNLGSKTVKSDEAFFYILYFFLGVEPHHQRCYLGIRSFCPGSEYHFPHSTNVVRLVACSKPVSSRRILLCIFVLLFHEIRKLPSKPV